MSDIEAHTEEIVNKPTKVKKERSVKQKEVFERARKIRAENLRYRRSEPVEEIEAPEEVKPIVKSKQIEKPQIKPKPKQRNIEEDEVKPKKVAKSKPKILIEEDENSSSSSEEYIIRRIKKNDKKVKELTKRFNPFDV